MLKLYYLQGACPLVPHTALHWAKAEFEAVRLERGEQRQPAFLALNPQGSVPLLQDGDWTLTQNIAILEYINSQYPEAHVFGTGDARAQAQARKWLAVANSDLHSKFGLLFATDKFVSSETAQTELRQNASAAIKNLYRIADEALAKQDYLAGNEITAGDVYFYVTERWANALGLDLSDLPHLAAHYTRVENNAGVQAALKDQGLL